MKKITFETKSLESAKKEAAKELRIDEKYVEITVLEKKGMLSKKYVVEASITVDPADIGYDALVQLFENMEIEANIEMRRREENELVFSVNTNENPILIGKNGKTLESIQFYIRNLVNNYSEERLIVLVDIGGYKDNRKRQLEILATKTAKQVAKTRIEAKLQPMNAYERRIIHTKLAEWRDVTTISEGEGTTRHLVIKPKRR